MAKVSISAARALMEHVDPYEGIEWQGVEQSLTSLREEPGGGGGGVQCRAGGYARPACQEHRWDHDQAGARLDESRNVSGKQGTIRCY
jgi:hypothetical protein